MRSRNSNRKYSAEFQTRGNNVPGKNVLEIILLTICVVAALFFSGSAEAAGQVRVVSDEGKPLQNASVFIDLKYPDNAKPKLTNASGEVVLAPVAAGKEIAITAFRTGYFPATVMVKPPGNATIKLRKVVKRATVTVLDEKGKPLPNVRIAAAGKMSETNAEGVATLELALAEKSMKAKILCSTKVSRTISISFGTNELAKEVRGTCRSLQQEKDADTAAAALKKPVPEPVAETRKEEQKTGKDRATVTFPAKADTLKQEKAVKSEEVNAGAVLIKPVPAPAPELKKEIQKDAKDKAAKAGPAKPDTLPAQAGAEKKSEPTEKSRPVETASIKPAPRPVPETRKDSAPMPEAVKVTPAIARATEKLDECRGYFRGGNYLKAAETCGQVPEERTTAKIYAEAVHVRGLAFLRMDWKPEAKREFQRNVDKMPNYAASNLELGIINVTEGKSADALSYLISAHAGSTQLGGRDRCRLFLFTAKAYEQLGNYVEAKKYLRGLLELKDCSESDRKSAADKLNEY